MDQPPENTDKDLKEYLVRVLTSLESRVLNNNLFPTLTSLPVKPIKARLYYFSNAILPNITVEGFWAYIGGVWVKVS